jgi:hypothetical protein
MLTGHWTLLCQTYLSSFTYLTQRYRSLTHSLIAFCFPIGYSPAPFMPLDDTHSLTHIRLLIVYIAFSI